VTTPVSSGRRGSNSSGTWSLRRRLARFLSLIGVLVLAMVTVAIILLFQVRTQQHVVTDRYFTAVNTSTQRFVAQVDAETAVRGYALSHDPVTLQPIGAFVSPSYRAQFNTLQRLLHGDVATDDALANWQQRAEAWYTQWALPSVVHVKAGHPLTARAVLAGKALFDANRAGYAQFSDVLVAKRNAATSALELRIDLLFAAVIVAAAGIAAAGGALWLALRSWVLQPIAGLGRETRMVTSGALDHEVIARGATEITELGTDVEAMRREIVTQLAEVQRAQKEIEFARLRLEEQATDLERSNRDLEQFAYVASHDLQEPLRKVASFCQMLERRYAGQLDERADQYIAFAVDGAKRMQQLINDLLAFSRVGRVTEGFHEVDLQVCLDTALDNLSPTIESSGGVVTADPLPHVRGERPLLIQVFQNLIGNALKFRGEAAPRVHIGATRNNGTWEFCCADNGIGIEPQYADRIFVIFQRLHGKDEFTGTGIGLALCKRIVEHHEGQIWMDTSVTEGATFRWTLPALVAGSQETEPALDAGSQETGPTLDADVNGTAPAVESTIGETGANDGENT